MNVLEAIGALNNGCIIKTINERGFSIFYIIVKIPRLSIEQVWYFESDDGQYACKRPESLEDCKTYCSANWDVKTILKSEFFLSSVDEILTEMQKVWDESHKESEE